MGEIQILKHSRNTVVKYFHNVALKALKTNLCYVNEVLFEMVITYLNDKCLGGTTPTSLKMRSLHARKYIIIERLALCSISQ